MDVPPRRRLGRTGLTVSPVGFGAFKIGRNQGIKYAAGYDLPDDETSDRLLHRVLDLGIDLIDTAPAYGSSEERIGRALSGRRDDFTLSTKVGETWRGDAGHYDFSPDAVEGSLERSLKALRTDRLDLVFVHSDGSDRAILERGEVLEVLERRRDAGDLRFIGFSGKTVEGHLAAIESGAFDALMVEFHPLEPSQRPVIEAASAADVGIVVKKGLASGRLEPRDALPFCLEPPGVATVVIGSLTPEHLADNLAIARRACAPPQSESR